MGRKLDLVRVVGSLLALSAQGCAQDRGEIAAIGGQTQFVSADWKPATGPIGGPDYRTDWGPAEQASFGISRLTSDGEVLYVNPYRGLQLIDVADPQNPKVGWSFPLGGRAVDMHVLGERVFVLLSVEQEGRTFEQRAEGALHGPTTGAVVVLDRDLEGGAPTQVARHVLEGEIITSRLSLTRGSVVLHVAEHSSPQDIEGAKTVLRSFLSTDDAFTQVGRVEVQGWARDVQTDLNYFLVARFGGLERNADGHRPGGRVALVNIVDPGGKMVVEQDVTLLGNVGSESNMRVRHGVLQVVSHQGAGFTGEPVEPGEHANFLQTFAIHTPGEAPEISSCGFGGYEKWVPTTFVQDRVFFATEQQGEFLNAFSITEDGRCEQSPELAIAGRHDFLHPVAGGTRLIAIGPDEEAGQNRLVVSLYDITDLASAEPLVARSYIDLGGAISNVDWHEHAFSVLGEWGTGATQGELNGESSTGLMLLPFEGWDRDNERVTSGVHALTFSEGEWTSHGVMDHAGTVASGLTLDAKSSAVLSEGLLSLHGRSTSEPPRRLGHLELAPDYSEVFRFGDYLARVERSPFYGRYWSSDVGQSLLDTVEIIRADSDANEGEVLATFAVPSEAKLIQVGDLLVSVFATIRVEPGMHTSPSWPDKTIVAVDLSKPTEPKLGKELVLMQDGEEFDGQEAGVYATADALVLARQRSTHDDGSGLWLNDRFDVVDLSDASAPVFVKTVEFPEADEVTSVVASEGVLYCNSKRSAQPGVDGRALVKRYVTQIDLTVPSAPEVRDAINIPGEVILTAGQDIYVHDRIWSGDRIKSVLSRLRFDAEQMTVLASSEPDYRASLYAMLDGSGRLLVSHKNGPGDGADDAGLWVMTVLSDDGLEKLGQASVPESALLERAVAGRSYWRLHSGIMVVNYEDPSDVYRQAYWDVPFFTSGLLTGDELLVAAGRYGMRGFDVTTQNLTRN